MPAVHYEFQVKVTANYMREQSNEAENHYVFTYRVQITNVGNIGAQLMSRHWIITDANSKVEEVRGLGVVGQQPFLKPGEQYEYVSGAVLATSVGVMRGVYHLVAEDGMMFEAAIPAFTLSIPRVLH